MGNTKHLSKKSNFTSDCLYFIWFHYTTHAKNLASFYKIRSRVQKFPAWHKKATPNGKCCEGYIVPSRVTSSQTWKVCWNKGRLRWKIVKLFYFSHLKKLVRPETSGSYYVIQTVGFGDFKPSSHVGWQGPSSRMCFLYLQGWRVRSNLKLQRGGWRCDMIISAEFNECNRV